jgi:ornithine cyclodeaminase/alanine dehydrogenase-like protein (mu-crystallin family)
MRVLDGDELRRALSMSAAIDALEAGFRSRDPSAQPLRSHLATPAGSLLLMPAFGDAGVGVKLVTLTPDNPERALPYIDGVYVLFDPVTQTPEAIVGGIRAGDAPPGQPGRRATHDLRRRRAGALPSRGDGRGSADPAPDRRLADP